MQKLTLSVDERVVARAKRYARARGTSVSRLVEAYLDVMQATDPGGTPPGTRRPPPVLARLRGSLKAASIEEYRDYLERKFR